MSIVPLMQAVHYPHERCLIFINLGFVFLEFIFGAVLIRSFIQNQAAAFYLRTAPVIDKNFQKRITGAEDVMSVREIQLGMQKYDPQRDAIEPFAASDDYLRTFGPKKMRKPTNGRG